MGKLEGKVTIVTGSATGMGRAAALLFAKEGATVVVADYDEAKGRETTDDIVRDGGKATFIKTDVSRAEEVEALVNQTVVTYGRLDVMYNNAGILGQVAPTADCSLENWRRIISVNLDGVFHGIKYAVPAMLKSGGGSIINTASNASLVGFPGLPAYCASKGGVIQLTKAAALEYAQQGIRVNCICPGGIQTPLVEGMQGQVPEEQRQTMVQMMHPIGRMGQPEEVARLALFLASDDSSFCTGAPFIVDGGMVAQ